MTDSFTNQCFALLRFALGVDSEFKGENVDWTKVLDFARKQAIVGVMFEGIKRLPNDISPKGPMLFQWIGQAQAIERQNHQLNLASAAVYRRIRQLGFDNCILKGQGNAMLYANPFSRAPGDIDVWVGGRNDNAQLSTDSAPTPPSISRKDLRSLALRLAGGDASRLEETYQHIALSVKGIEVELHPTPTLLCSPLHNRRLQRWIKAQQQEQFAHLTTLPEESGQIATPNRTFNLVYQLLHLYHHHLFEGIGLRQFVDYFLLIKSTATQPAPSFDSLGLSLTPFASAVMWVMGEVFGLRRDEMLTAPDEKRGRLLLHDILRGGNFGHHDTRFARTALGHNLQRLQRDWQLLRFYPYETLCEPIFRLWHFLWRKTHGL